MPEYSGKILSKLQRLSQLRQQTESISALETHVPESLSEPEAKYFPKSTVERSAFDLSERLPGTWINSSCGDIFRAEYIQSLSEPYGHCDLSAALDMKLPDLKRSFSGLPESLPDENLSQILFLDTETTGLSQGGGSLAFLVGLAWIQGQNFHVHQYFVDQPGNEEGMLELIQPILRRYPLLILFNGKSYDLPLLNTRFILNRMSPLQEDLTHLDLLHHSRSIWKYSLQDCRLSTLEEDILGLQRDEDIPGDLIPAAYFDYLRSRSADALEQVFIHNRYDMISMLAVLLSLIREKQHADKHEDALVDYALGRISVREKASEKSIRYFEQALEGDLSSGRRQQIRLELAAVHKKNGTFSDDCRIWEDIISSEGPFPLEAYIELAKYHEHRSRNLQEALSFCEDALSLLPPWLFEQRSPLLKRRNRLLRKIQSHE